jgi:hypothetical protein
LKKKCLQNPRLEINVQHIMRPIPKNGQIPILYVGLSMEGGGTLQPVEPCGG